MTLVKRCISIYIDFIWVLPPDPIFGKQQVKPDSDPTLRKYRIRKSGKSYSFDINLIQKSLKIVIGDMLLKFKEPCNEKAFAFLLHTGFKKRTSFLINLSFMTLVKRCISMYIVLNMGFGSSSGLSETVVRTGFGSDALEISDLQIWRKKTQL